MRSLDHRILRQFLAVADHGTVRAASRALNMSQPPLTQALRLLEERLGVVLFHRTPRGMRLTAAGAALADEARPILAALDRAERRVREEGARPEPLRIGFVSAALNEVLPALLRGLAAGGRPTPRLFEMTTPEQLDALADARIDVALLHPPVPDDPLFPGRPLGRDPFLAAVPEAHPLAARADLCFAEVVREPLVLFPEAQGPVLHARIRAAAEAAAGSASASSPPRRPGR